MCPKKLIKIQLNKCCTYYQYYRNKMNSDKSYIAAGPGLGLSTPQLYAAVEYVQ